MCQIKNIGVLLRNLLGDLAKLIDRGNNFSCDIIRKQVENENIYTWLKKNTDVQGTLNINNDEEISYLEKELSSIAINYKTSIEKNGLCLLISFIKIGLSDSNK